MVSHLARGPGVHHIRTVSAQGRRCLRMNVRAVRPDVGVVVKAMLSRNVAGTIRA